MYKVSSEIYDKFNYSGITLNRVAQRSSIFTPFIKLNTGPLSKVPFKETVWAISTLNFLLIYFIIPGKLAKVSPPVSKH